MSRARTRRVAVFAAAAFVIAGAVTSVLGVTTGLCSVSRLEWVVPFIAGLLIAAVILLLADGRPKEDSPVAEVRRGASECVACGSPILEEWRLCPHCGTLRACDVKEPTREETREIRDPVGGEKERNS